MKKVFCVMVFLTILLTLCACGNSQKKSEGTSASSDTEKQIITDILGRKVEIPFQIDTVACEGSAARHMVYAGAVDKIVGVTDMEKKGEAVMPYANVNNDSFATCASVGSGWPGNEIYTEELMTLEPDVIVYFTSDATAADELQAQVGIPVIAIYASEFYSEDFIKTLGLLGTVMETKDHTDAVISKIQGYITDLNSRTKDISDEEKPSVYIGAVSFKGLNGFEGTYGEYPPFVAINARNVVDETGKTGGMLIDLEKVSVWDPDIIFVNTESLDIVNKDYAANPGFYNNLTAVKNGQVYSQAGFNAWHTNMEIAIIDAYYAGSIIYPEQFADITFKEKAEEIFNLMIGSDYLKVMENAGMGFKQIKIGK